MSTSKKQVPSKPRQAKSKTQVITKPRRPRPQAVSQQMQRPAANLRAQADQYASNRNHSRAVSRYLKNTLVPQQAMCGPAIAGTTSGATMIKTDVPLVKNPTNDGALFFTNHPKVPILQSVYDDGALAFNSATQPALATNGEDVSIGPEYYTTASGALLPVRIEDTPQFVREGGVAGTFTRGALVVTTKPSQVVFNMKNNGAVTQSFTFKAWRRSNGVAFVLDSQSTVAANAGGTVNFTLNIVESVMADWVFTIVATGIASWVGITPTTLTINTTGAYSWSPVPWLGSTPGTIATDNWWNSCPQTRVLIASALLSNYTSTIYKGGQLSACTVRNGQLPECPSDPTALISWMTNNPTTIKNTSMQLSEGCYVPYVPQELEDLQFKRKLYGSGDLRANPNMIKPVLLDLFKQSGGYVIAWKQSDDLQFSPELKVVVTMVLEGISNEQIIPQRKTPHITELWTDWMGYIVGPDLIQENPKHIKQLYNKVATFVKNPENQALIRKYGNRIITGVEIAAGVAALVL